MQLSKLITHKLKALVFRTKCILLLLKNLVLLKALRIREVELLQKIAIEGSEIDLIWMAQGCHRIKVKGVGMVGGNSCGLRFKLQDVSNPIEICFYGIAKKEFYKICFHGMMVNLLNKFHAHSFLPITVLAPQNYEKLESSFSQAQLATTFENISFEFEEFNQNNYPPQTTITL